jgi:hypothetical protein
LMPLTLTFDPAASVTVLFIWSVTSCPIKADELPDVHDTNRQQNPIIRIIESEVVVFIGLSLLLRIT